MRGVACGGEVAAVVWSGGLALAVTMTPIKLEIRGL
jgi:hypothetical protein